MSKSRQHRLAAWTLAFVLRRAAAAVVAALAFLTMTAGGDGTVRAEGGGANADALAPSSATIPDGLSATDWRRMRAAINRDRARLHAQGRHAFSYRALEAWDATGRRLRARMAVEGGTIRLGVEDGEAIYPLTIDPWIEVVKPRASDAALADQLGISVAISNDTALVGANGDDGRHRTDRVSRGRTHTDPAGDPYGDA